MKKILFALAALAFVASSCIKTIHDPEEIDETPAQLVSFKLLAADNEGLDADYEPEAIAASMVIRIPGGGQGKTLKATLTAGENDEIKVNDAAVADGKASFDASFPVDIVVTNTKSRKSAQYEVKIGKILQLVSKKAGNLTTAAGAMQYKDTYYKVAKNPVTGEFYVAYCFTPSGGKRNVGVAKFDGTKFVQVGTEGLSPAVENVTHLSSIAFDDKGMPYVLYIGGDVKNTFTLRKFDGTEWTVFGGGSFGTKPGTTLSSPSLYFNASGNPAVSYQQSTRSHGILYWDGNEWKESLITGFPVYTKNGERAANEGIFYLSTYFHSNGKMYGVFSCNYYGLYIYELSGDAWVSAGVEDFIPEGEKTALPGNLSAIVTKDNKVLVFSALWNAAAMQLFEYTGSALVPYGNSFPIAMSSSGGAGNSRVAVNPVTGEIMAVKADADNNIVYSIFNADKQWEGFLPLTAIAQNKEESIPASNGGMMELFYDAAGTAFVLWPDAAAGDAGYLLYSIGLEDDILPE